MTIITPLEFLGYVFCFWAAWKVFDGVYHLVKKPSEPKTICLDCEKMLEANQKLIDENEKIKEDYKKLIDVKHKLVEDNKRLARDNDVLKHVNLSNKDTPKMMSSEYLGGHKMGEYAGERSSQYASGYATTSPKENWYGYSSVQKPKEEIQDLTKIANVAGNNGSKTIGEAVAKRKKKPKPPYAQRAAEAWSVQRAIQKINQATERELMQAKGIRTAHADRIRKTKPQTEAEFKKILPGALVNSLLRHFATITS